MPTTCAVADCQNTKKLCPGLVFHRFPAHDRNLVKVWKNKCRRTAQFKITNSVVCSEHFLEEDYERDLQNELLGLPVRRKLKKDVVPTVFKYRRENNSISSKNNNSSDVIKSRKQRLEERRRKKLVDDIIRGSVDESSNDAGAASKEIVTESDLDTREVHVTERVQCQSENNSISTQTDDDEFKSRYESKLLTMKKRYESKLLAIKGRLQSELGNAKEQSMSLTMQTTRWKSLVFSYVLKNVKLKSELQTCRRNTDRIVRSMFSHSRMNEVVHGERNGPSLEDHSYC